MKIVDVACAIVLAAVGAGFLDLGLEIRADQGPYAHGVTTTATTTSFRTERTVNRRRKSLSNHYRAVYTFRTRTGETATFADPIAVDVPPHLGRTVVLSYHPSEPEKARVVRGWHGWTVFPVIFSTAGALLLGCVVYIVGRNLIRRRADRES